MTKLNILFATTISILASCYTDCKNHPVQNSIKNKNSLNRINSGVYKDLKLAVLKDSIFGAYEYFDKWNNDYKVYEDICTFYFVGNKVNDTFQIVVKWPEVEDSFLKGKLFLANNMEKDSIRIILSNQPYGYAAVDFDRKVI